MYNWCPVASGAPGVAKEFPGIAPVTFFTSDMEALCSGSGRFIAHPKVVTVRLARAAQDGGAGSAPWVRPKVFSWAHRRVDTSPAVYQLPPMTGLPPRGDFHLLDTSAG